MGTIKHDTLEAAAIRHVLRSISTHVHWLEEYRRRHGYQPTGEHQRRINSICYRLTALGRPEQGKGKRDA